MEDVNSRLELCEFWNILIASDYNPRDAYTDTMCMLSHDNDVPEIDITDTVSEQLISSILSIGLQPCMTDHMNECYKLPQMAVRSSTARADDTCLTLLLSPRVDNHELGHYVTQLLIMFDYHETALQIALNTHKALSQVSYALYGLYLEACPDWSFRLVRDEP